MVNFVLIKIKEYRYFASLILLVMLNVNAENNAENKVHFSNTKAMVGESITLYIKGDNIKNSFTPDLVKQIKQYFFIYQVDENNDRIRIVLYPQSPQSFTFPAWDKGDIQLKATSFQINPNPNISIKWELNSNEFYVRQTLQWKADVYLTESNYSSQLKVIDIESENNSSNIFSLENNQYNVIASSKPVVSYLENKPSNNLSQIFYANYFFKKHGNIRLPIPFIEVKNRTQRNWRFFAYKDKHRYFTTKLLPQYLPDNISQGELIFDDFNLPSVISTGKLFMWKISLTGKLMPVYALPNLQRYLSVEDSIELLRPKIDKKMIFNSEGLKSNVVLQQPIRFLNSGYQTLPDINVTYFNSTKQRLEQVYLPSQTILVIPVILINFAKLLVIILGIVIFLFGFWGIKIQQQRRLYFQRISTATAPQELWKALYAWIQFVLPYKYDEDKYNHKLAQKTLPIGYILEKFQIDTMWNFKQEVVSLEVAFNQILFDAKPAITLKQVKISTHKFIDKHTVSKLILLRLRKL